MRLFGKIVGVNVVILLVYSLVLRLLTTGRYFHALRRDRRRACSWLPDDIVVPFFRRPSGSGQGMAWNDGRGTFGGVLGLFGEFGNIGVSGSVGRT